MVVRRDLGMGTGKIAAQVAHAAVMAAERTKHRKPEWFETWFEGGQAKVVVKVQSLEELMQVRQRAEALSLPVVQVNDSGLTQIPAGTTTCIGIGPAPADLIDRVTSDLKLL
ncbi:MAG: aminoacyl-tRNA hydrolase [Nitrososphaera sp.]|nr:aminoacyl-tRNA hydrolase [Nitrososphaera sp.]